MSIGTVLANSALAVASGGAAGWLSSVYAAGPVARRQEAARLRMEAQRKLTEVVTEYLGRLRIVNDERTMYPEGYADLASREKLASGVLAALLGLPSGSQGHIHVALLALVGRATLDLATKRSGVPEDARPPAEDENTRRKHEERHLRLGYHDGVGCKSETYHLCERDHFPPLRRDYGELAVLWLTSTNPHSGFHQDEYQRVTELLEQILNAAQARAWPPWGKFRAPRPVTGGGCRPATLEPPQFLSAPISAR